MHINRMIENICITVTHDNIWDDKLWSRDNTSCHGDGSVDL